MAWELGIGFENVRSDIDNIDRKFRVRTRTEAVVKFLGPSRTPRFPQLPGIATRRAPCTLAPWPDTTSRSA